MLIPSFALPRPHPSEGYRLGFAEELEVVEEAEGVEEPREDEVGAEGPPAPADWCLAAAAAAAAAELAAVLLVVAARHLFLCFFIPGISQKKQVLLCFALLLLLIRCESSRGARQGRKEAWQGSAEKAGWLAGWLLALSRRDRTR